MKSFESSVPARTAASRLGVHRVGHARQQCGNIAVLTLAGVVMVLVGLVLLWLWAAVLISALVGLAVFVVLVQPVRLGWMVEGRRARQDPSRLIEDGRLRSPIWMPFYAMFAALTATAAGCVTLFLLPDSLKSTSMVQMGMGLAGGVVMLVLIWLLGQLVTGCTLLRAGEDWNAKRMSPEWWVWGAIAFVPTMLAVAFMAPNDAGGQAWSAQIRGYDSMPIRITLAPASQPAQASARNAALLQLVEPLLVQSSRLVRVSVQGRHGTNRWLAAVPARYRFQGDVLEIRTGGRLNPEAISIYAEVLQKLSEDGGAAVQWLASVQCLPKPSALAALDMGHRRAQREQKWMCEQQRRPQLGALAEALHGQIQQVEVLPLARMRVWPWQREWQAVSLPSGDALADLPMMAR